MPIDSAGGSGFVYFPEEDPSKQPVEVWVRSGGLGTLLGKIPGVNIPFKCVISPEVIPCPTAHNRPLPWLQNSVGTQFRLLKLAIRPCLNLALLKKDLYYYVLPGFMPYDARVCLILCCLDLLCLVQLTIDAIWPVYISRVALEIV